MAKNVKKKAAAREARDAYIVLRNQHIIGLRREGHSLDAIGAEYRISRERVRQILKTVAPELSEAKMASKIEVLDIVTFIRSTQCTSIQPIASHFKMGSSSLNRMLVELGLLEVVHRLFRWRRGHAQRGRRQAAIDMLHAFVVKHGRVPTSMELGFSVGVPRHPELRFGAVNPLFGSYKNMFAMAGLTSRGRGAVSHLYPSKTRTPRTHCRRGHSVAHAGEVFLHMKANGVHARECKQCNKERSQRYYAKKRREVQDG